MKSSLFLLVLLTLFACDQNPAAQTSPIKNQPERSVGGGCECCEAWQDGLPPNLDWQTTIAPENEPGEPLEISGTIFQNDGKTPAADIILYLYHTDNQGLYSDGQATTTCGKRHGHLRGWMQTGPDGCYFFRTIRPASYPNSSAEQHIHPIIKEPGIQAYWIDEFVFDDDPNLTQQARNRSQNRGGNGILKMEKNAKGVWTGRRDIVLGLNVNGY